jgi:hypothetical protein
MKKNRTLLFGGSMALALFLFAVTVCADQLTSIEQATHIIRGTVENTETEFAGGIIPITHVWVRVNDVMKNSDNSLSTNSLIRILVYGCETSDNVLTTSNEEMILFKKGQQIIVPLKKYYEHYRLFELDDPFALTFVTDNSVAGYDEGRENEPQDKTPKQDYFLRQQQEFKNHESLRMERIHYALYADKMLSKSTRYLRDKDIANAQYFMDLVGAKAHYSSINVARASASIVKVKVMEIRTAKAGGEGLEIVCNVIQNIRGKRFSKELIVPVAGKKDLDDRGILLPKIGDSGLLLLNPKGAPINSPDFFIKEDNNGLVVGGNEHVSDQSFLQLLSEEN